MLPRGNSQPSVHPINFAKKKVVNSGKIHGQIRVQIAYAIGYSISHSRKVGSERAYLSDARRGQSAQLRTGQGGGARPWALCAGRKARPRGREGGEEGNGPRGRWRRGEEREKGGEAHRAAPSALLRTTTVVVPWWGKLAAEGFAERKGEMTLRREGVVVVSSSLVVCAAGGEFVAGLGLGRVEWTTCALLRPR
jgi:hypothetical protein